MIRKTYNWIVDHLTKVLGVVGAAIMSATAWIDPVEIMAAADRYLRTEHSVLKVGAFLFVLLVFRGWYTGRKGKQLAEQVAAATGKYPALKEAGG